MESQNDNILLDALLNSDINIRIKEIPALNEQGLNIIVALTSCLLFYFRLIRISYLRMDYHL